MSDWLGELLSVPVKEYTSFEAALSVIAARLRPRCGRPAGAAQCPRVDDHQESQRPADRPPGGPSPALRPGIGVPKRPAARRVAFVDALIAEIEGETLDGLARGGPCTTTTPRCHSSNSRARRPRRHRRGRQSEPRRTRHHETGRWETGRHEKGETSDSDRRGRGPGQAVREGAGPGRARSRLSNPASGCPARPQRGREVHLRAHRGHVAAPGRRFAACPAGSTCAPSQRRCAATSASQARRPPSRER